MLAEEMITTTVNNLEMYNSFRIHSITSTLVWQILKETEDKKTFDILPYNKSELMQRLEGQFSEEMTWENYGKYWHVDHIIPRALFKVESYEDATFKECWTLINLRPLKARDNLIKGSKMIGTVANGKEVR